MDVETIATLVGAGVSFAGVATGFILNVRKSRKELKLAEQREKDEANARKKAEKESFYLTTAANLVASAERLNITGPQKKEYVMTWLENEAIKSEIEVDKPLMSVAIERTILLMNDHRHSDKPVAELLQEDLDKSVKKEFEKIGETVTKAKARIEDENTKAIIQAKAGVGITQKAIDDVANILKKK